MDMEHIKVLRRHKSEEGVGRAFMVHGEFQELYVW